MSQNDQSDNQSQEEEKEESFSEESLSSYPLLDAILRNCDRKQEKLNKALGKKRRKAEEEEEDLKNNLFSPDDDDDYWILVETTYTIQEILSSAQFKEIVAQAHPLDKNKFCSENGLKATALNVEKLLEMRIQKEEKKSEKQKEALPDIKPDPEESHSAKLQKPSKESGLKIKEEENVRTTSERNKQNEKQIEKLVENQSEKPIERGNEKVIKREIEKSSEKRSEKVIEKDNEKIKEKKSEKGDEKLNEKRTGKVIERGSEKISEKRSEKRDEKLNEKRTEKVIERGSEKISEKVIEKGNEKLNEKRSEKVIEKGNENISKNQTIKREILPSPKKIQQSLLTRDIYKIPKKKDIKKDIENLRFQGDKIRAEIEKSRIFPSRVKEPLTALIRDVCLVKEAEIVEGQKLNIVFDLDSTLIFSDLKIAESYFHHDKDRFYFSLEAQHYQRTLFVSVCFRQGLSTMFSKLKDFCNFYVYTLATYPYAKEIIKKIEEQFGVTIKDWKCNLNGQRLKYFEELNINENHSLILDDRNDVWSRVEIILNSKLYLNTFYLDFNHRLLKPGDFGFMSANVIDVNDFSSLELFPRDDVFIENKERIPYHVELEDDPKPQLNYIGEGIEKIYNIVNILKCNTSTAIKLLRLTLFNGFCFDLHYCQCSSRYKIHKLISTCGGEIKFFTEMPVTHFIVSNESLMTYKIDEPLKSNPNCKAVNPRFIVDTFYLLTLMDDDDKVYQVC